MRSARDKLSRHAAVAKKREEPAGMGEDVGPDDREGCRAAIERFAETVVEKCR